MTKPAKENGAEGTFISAQATSAYSGVSRPYPCWTVWVGREFATNSAAVPCRHMEFPLSQNGGHRNTI